MDNIPSDIAELKKRDDWPLWKEAIEAELASLEKNRTWSLTGLPAGRRPVGNKWVFTIKQDGEGKIDRYKARLVAKGFTEEIYMRQPSGFEAGNDLVCKLNKAIYGLKQASRSWNMRFHTFITSIGFQRS